MNVNDIDFTRASELGDLLIDQLSSLSQSTPIAWHEKQNAWIVTRHDLVLKGLSGDLPLSASRIGRVISHLPADELHKIPTVLATIPRFVVTMDPPEQLRIRKLMLRAFNRKLADAERPFVRDLTRSILSAAAKKERVEFVEQVARQITGRLLLRLLGLDEKYLPKLTEWIRASVLTVARANMPLALANEASFLESRALLQKEIDKRRREPQDDFITALVAAEEDGDRLSDDDIIATLQLSLVAGHSTTTDTMALIVRAMLRKPELVDMLRDHITNLDGPILELMRVVAMSTAQSRTALEAFEWEGVHIKKGDLIYLFLAAGNRDPSIFPNPKEFDLDREQFQNLTFAPGLHHCIGMYFAKMQLREVFTELLSHYDVSPAGELNDWTNGLAFRGLNTLYISLSERKDGQHNR